MLGIPYTASRVLTQAISLDKVATKRLWRDSGLPIAPFQVFTYPEQPLDSRLSFPLFVKPSREGTGMGINDRSVVRDEASLREQVRWIINSYHQPALVEAFLPGREFTVGLVGNALRPGEAPPSDFYDARGYHVFPVLEIDVRHLGGVDQVYTSHIKSVDPLAPKYLCPAPIDDALAEQLQTLAVQAFEAIGCLDVARVDFKLDAQGQPVLLEINTLPGLNPTYSDIVMAARAEGVPYNALVLEVLRQAMRRYRLDGAA
jgi:D-alanine-D-alanine ligase